MSQVAELIRQGDFESAEIVFEKDRDECLFEIQYAAEESNAVLYYSFLTHRLIKGETADGHLAACEFMISCCFLPGGYATALVHARRGLQLEPCNLDIKRMMLLFYEIPDRLLSRAEAVSLAKEILAHDPHHEIALSVRTGASLELVQRAQAKGIL